MDLKNLSVVGLSVPNLDARFLCGCGGSCGCGCGVLASGGGSGL